MVTIDEILDKHHIVRYRDYFKKVMEDYAKEVINCCAESAEVRNEGTYNRGGESDDYFVVDKESILRLKNDVK